MSAENNLRLFAQICTDSPLTDLCLGFRDKTDVGCLSLDVRRPETIMIDIIEKTNAAVPQGQRMTSLEIAQLAGKPHNDVMKAIRKMEPAWVSVNGGNFSLVDYKDAKGEMRPCYSLTKTECLYIATKFNDEARARLVLRWEQLELAERQRWMAQQTGKNIIDLRGTNAQNVIVVLTDGRMLPLPEYRPYHGPIRKLLARTAHGIIREGTEDYTLYVRISKAMCEAVDVTPREMFEHELYQLLKKMEEQIWN